MSCHLASSALKICSTYLLVCSAHDTKKISSILAVFPLIGNAFVSEHVHTYMQLLHRIRSRHRNASYSYASFYTSSTAFSVHTRGGITAHTVEMPPPEIQAAANPLSLRNTPVLERLSYRRPPSAWLIKTDAPGSHAIPALCSIRCHTRNAGGAAMTRAQTGAELKQRKRSFQMVCSV